MATAQQKTRTKQAKPKTPAASATTGGAARGRRRTTSGSGNGASPNGSSRVKTANTGSRTRASSSSNGAARNGRAKAANSKRHPGASGSSKGASPRRQPSGARSGAQSRTTGNRSQRQSGMLAKVGHVGSDVVHGIDRAKPAIAVGMTALGVAGGIAFRRRQRTVLGIAVPRKPDGVDIIALSKAIGKGSLHLSQTARNISRDIDQAAERAEKIGKILS